MYNMSTAKKKKREGRVPFCEYILHDFMSH